jgi:hypothetical protein
MPMPNMGTDTKMNTNIETDTTCQNAGLSSSQLLRYRNEKTNVVISGPVQD